MKWNDFNENTNYFIVLQSLSKQYGVLSSCTVLVSAGVELWQNLTNQTSSLSCWNINWVHSYNRVENYIRTSEQAQSPPSISTSRALVQVSLLANSTGSFHLIGCVQASAFCRHIGALIILSTNNYQLTELPLKSKVKICIVLFVYNFIVWNTED